MAKRSSTRPSGGQAWRARLTGPLAQQLFALMLLALSVVTLLSLTGVTSGDLADAWERLLRWVFGWGAYVVAAGIGAAAFLLLQHHLDRPVTWRWRPLVGGELVFVALLALTQTLFGRTAPWTLVETGRGGGIVGWGVAVLLAFYVGWPATALILLTILVLGLGLLFDVTRAEAADAMRAVWGWVAERWVARRERPVREAPPSRPARRPVPPSPRVASPEPAPAPVPRRKPLPPARAVERPLTGRRAVAAPLQLPPLDLLDEGEEPVLSDQEVRENAAIIVETLAQFGLPVEISEVRQGPAVTQFGVKPGFIERKEASGRTRQHKVRVSQISALADDLALALAAPSLRVEAPVPGRAVVGIEVPNREIALVRLREVMEAGDFRRLRSPLAIGLGQDVAGGAIVADLATMPHLLIAGTTGSGKSVCVKAITICLVYNNTPEALRLVMIDPKMVELMRFNGLPHLYGRVETDLERIVKVLRWVARQMDGRFERFSAEGARHLDDYNRMMKRQQEPLPRIVILVDELADLMMLAPDEVERTICRIAQMARATGIHLVVATQRPSVDVVTGLIKANFPARISFATASQVDSRVILDMPGAETLLGRGDMLYLAADAGHPVRVQGCFVSDEEVERVVAFWREQVGAVEEEAPWERVLRGKVTDEGTDDELLERAMALVRELGGVSASLLQRRLRIGYPRAARLMDQLEEMGVVGPPETGGRARQVIGGGE